MYLSKLKKPKKFDFDLIVIGSGAGGGVAAHLAANDGKKVGLIESHSLGGEIPHSGSIPTKVLLKSAITLDELQKSMQFGIRANNISFNYFSVQAWKEKAITSTGVRNESKLFKTEGITIIHGHAHFISPWLVNVGQRHFSARKFLIATGSSPAIPLIPGLTEAGYITYREASHLNKLPKSLFIIGGGATAYEFAQIFSAFGVKVHVAEFKDHLLPREDPEISDSAEAALMAKGVRVHTKTTIVHIAGVPKRKVVTFEQYGQQHRIAVEEILVATGKLPNLDLGLENIGLNCSKDGIKVNRFMRTSKKHIYAAGDVTGQYTSNHSHVAIQQGRIAIHNMYHLKKVAMTYHAIPKCFYGIPEIATVGKTEREVMISGEPYQTAIAPIGIFGKAITNNYTNGFVKIIATHTGILLGAGVVAPSASEILPELTFAVQHRLHACAISNTMHLFPTWSEAVRVAADRIRCI